MVPTSDVQGCDPELHNLQRWDPPQMYKRTFKNPKPCRDGTHLKGTSLPSFKLSTYSNKRNFQPTAVNISTFWCREQTQKASTAVHYSTCSLLYLFTAPHVHCSTCSLFHMFMFHMFTIPHVHCSTCSLFYMFTVPHVHYSTCSLFYSCSLIYMFTALHVQLS
jgi:hypothetical protein